jgi:hypothetical protein
MLLVDGRSASFHHGNGVIELSQQIIDESLIAVMLLHDRTQHILIHLGDCGFNECDHVGSDAIFHHVGCRLHELGCGIFSAVRDTDLVVVRK